MTGVAHELDDFAAQLAAAFTELPAHLALVAAQSGGAANAEGGDPGGHGDARLLARHLGNYLVAASAAQVAGLAVDRLVDVGAGTGAFTSWLAARLSAAVEIVDHDPHVRSVAAAVTNAVGEHSAVEDVEPAPLVTAMEVLEHVAPDDQLVFCRGLLAGVAPGGLLVISTPDESLYPGGGSGYAPHVGCVTAGQLSTLLLDAGAGQVEVIRLVGGPFDTARSRRILEAVLNRVHGVARKQLPGVVAALEAREGRPSSTALTAPDDLGLARGVDAAIGAGGSLVAIVRR